jgi:hypothetical protein
MKKLFGFGVVALAAALIAGNAGNASAQTVGDELKCQANASKVIAKFVGSKVKCLNKCWSQLRKGDPVDCLDTPDDGDPRDAATQACIDAAETKSNSGQAKKCTADCPECYDGGNCPADAAGKTTTTESLIDTQDPTVHCNGGTVTADQGKCQDNTGKTLAKWVASLSKCTAKCRANEEKGKAAPGSCTPPASDPKTIDCINKAEPKCVSSIDKKCGDAGATPPCWSFPTNGTQWCNLVQGIVDGQYNEYFCGSPSGAFLE